MQAYQSASRLAEIHRYLRLQPDGWFLAWAGDQAVGLGGAIDYGAFGYVGLVSVLPEAQHGGIGRALMRHILAWRVARGGPMLVLDASVAGQPLYTQLGFVVDDASVVWKSGDAPRLTTTPDAALEQVFSCTNDDLAEIAAYDAARFGADRTAALADLLASHPGRAALTRDDTGRITGYALAQAQNIGPWLADDAPSARALLAWALALDAPPDGVLVPAQNTQAASLLAAAGFAPQRQLAHMRLGGTPRDRATHYGLASFTLG